MDSCVSSTGLFDKRYPQTAAKDIDTLQITPQEELDVACSLHTPTHTLMTIRHHIIYSPIYKLPVLYVMAYHQEGTPLSLEEMYEAIIPEHYHHSLKIASTSSQGSLTQADHPFLNIPAYYLHPCDTANLLETVGISQSPTLVYLQSWLSLLGPVVGCDALEFIT
ncbi:autophagocytosis associated protein [Spinellus fusiger]|nr:autophagocytosis associated protein [Spinellus fusiger]